MPQTVIELKLTPAEVEVLVKSLPRLAEPNGTVVDTERLRSKIVAALRRARVVGV